MSSDKDRKRDPPPGMPGPAALPLMYRPAISALEAHLVARVIGGQHFVRGLIIALLADGHALIDGPAGLAKTRATTALAKALEATFRRIALGPGQRMSHIFGAESSSLGHSHGQGQKPKPVFANILLAEGVDDAAPEVRTALLDAMTERHVVFDGIPFRLPDVFLVCATRTMAHTPVSTGGLGPNERDRFLLHLRVDYQDEAHERRMLALIRAENKASAGQATAPLPLATIIAARAGVQNISIGPRSVRWITALVLATRDGGRTRNGPARWIRSGAGPRGSIALERCARAHAWLAGRQRVSERDIMAVAHDVLRHRLDMADAAKDAGVQPDSVITELLALTRP